MFSDPFGQLLWIDKVRFLNVINTLKRAVDDDCPGRLFTSKNEHHMEQVTSTVRELVENFYMLYQLLCPIF